MSLLQTSFYAKLLGSMTGVSIYLPSPTSGQVHHLSLQQLYRRRRYPVLYLLHGMNEDESIWIRKSNLERYAQSRQMVIVMPRAENSFYTDMCHGQAYFSYLTQELPAFVAAHLPVYTDREHTYIAGLSMGGYGALKAAFCLPQQYAAAASLSGAVDVVDVYSQAQEMGLQAMAENVFGSKQTAAQPPHNLFAQTQQLIEKQQPLPALYLACGSEDTLCFAMNERFAAHLRKLQYPFVYHTGPYGHSWDFWDEQICQVLAWLPQTKEEEQTWN